MKIGDQVNVGGCVGKISDIDEVELTVSGEYRDFTETARPETWSMRFRIAELAGTWDDRYGEFDASAIDPIIS
jgi:hypothetical protein